MASVHFAPARPRLPELQNASVAVRSASMSAEKSIRVKNAI